MSDDLRIAVLGVGLMGSYHADHAVHSGQGCEGDRDQRLLGRHGCTGGGRDPRLPGRRGPVRRDQRRRRRCRGDRHPWHGARGAGDGLPGARNSGALREAINHQHRHRLRDREEGGGTGQATDPGRLHAALRHRVRRAAGADRRRRSGHPADGALRAPQPRCAAALQLRVHDPRLGRARGGRGALPARHRDHRRHRPQGARHEQGAGGRQRPDAGHLRDRVRRGRHRRDLRPDRRSPTRCAPRSSARPAARSSVWTRTWSGPPPTVAAAVRSPPVSSSGSVRRTTPSCSAGWTRRRSGTIDGPGAWDGYAAVAVCEAGVEAVRSGERVEVQMGPRP